MHLAPPLSWVRLSRLTKGPGKPVGAYFAGKGTLTFRPDDPQAGKLAVRNAKHVGAAEAADPTMLVDGGEKKRHP